MITSTWTMVTIKNKINGYFPITKWNSIPSPTTNYRHMQKTVGKINEVWRCAPAVNNNRQLCTGQGEGHIGVEIQGHAQDMSEWEQEYILLVRERGREMTCVGCGSMTTLIVLVWMRPLASVWGMRCTLWTPLSCFKQPKTPTPLRPALAYCTTDTPRITHNIITLTGMNLNSSLISDILTQQLKLPPFESSISGEGRQHWYTHYSLMLPPIFNTSDTCGKPRLQTVLPLVPQHLP